MNKKFYWIVLMLSFTLLVPAGWVKAQEPAGSGGQEPGDTPNITTLTYDLTWPDLFYEEVVLESQNVARYDLYVPKNIVPSEAGSYLDLVFSHNVITQTEKRVDMMVTFNRKLLDIIPLTPANGNQNTLRFDLSGNGFKPGQNRLEITLNSDGVCGEEVETGKTIAVIHETSRFHLEYQLPDREPDLGIYPTPFYERTFLPGIVYFVLPQQPTVADISTALSISAGLGIYSGGRVLIDSVLENELTDEIRQNNHLIIIGRPDTNSLLAELDLPFSVQNPIIKDDSGVLQEIVSPWNPQKNILVVTARSDTGLIKAGDVLNRDLNFLGMKGPIAIVQEVLPPSQNSTRQDVDVTFASLGYEDIVFYGTRPQGNQFEFWMPQSWQMTEEAKLFLSFNHSTIIDPKNSTLNVELNRVPVGGTTLNEENVVNGVMEVEVPAWLLEPGRNRLQVDVGMVLGEDPCANLDNRQIWTVVRRDSFVHLPYVEQDASFDLNLFPYPFDINANLTDVTLVLPDVLSRPERDRLLRLAVTLGQQAGGDRVTLRAIDSGNVDNQIKETNHLIVLGRLTNNALLRDLNDYLPQPFQPDTDQLASKLDSAILTEITTRNAGLLQEIVSPWNSEKTVLVITGTTDEGVASAFDLLLGDLPEEMGDIRIGGNLAVIEGERVASIDTRLLESLAEFPQQETQVNPIANPNTQPLSELANRWW